MPIQQKNRRQEEDCLYYVLTAAWKVGETASADAVACGLAIITPNQKIFDLFVIGCRAQNNRERTHYDGEIKRGRGETWRSSCIQYVSHGLSHVRTLKGSTCWIKYFLLLIFEG